MRPVLLEIDHLRARPGVKWHRYPDDVLPAWIAEMDFGTAEPIHTVLRGLVDEGAYGYEPAGRYVELADAFANHMQSRYGWTVDADNVLPVADLVQALFTTVTAFSACGQGVVLHMPIYPPFQNAVRETGRRIVEQPLQQDGTGRFNIDTATAAPLDGDTPLLLLCNPHNPTGRMFSRRELEAVAEAVIQRNAIVVSDEVHAELAYDGKAHIPLATLGADIAPRTITITSATKAYNIPGLRCGLMYFGSRELRERFRASIPDRMLGIVNRFGIEATVAAWRDGGHWLAEVMQVLHSNRARLGDFLATKLPEIGYSPPDGTYLAWLDCRGLGLPRSPFEFFLEKARVALSDGAEFGPQGQGHVRLNFATSPAILDGILARMANALES
ncbi:MAG: PatB family C-S lyase [Chloroflexi bacterium]|nr:PatB family C-S lyase [Chloroflexota bacterium]